jgi:hypothetical protein
MLYITQAVLLLVVAVSTVYCDDCPDVDACKAQTGYKDTDVGAAGTGLANNETATCQRVKDMYNCVNPKNKSWTDCPGAKTVAQGISAVDSKCLKLCPSVTECKEQTGYEDSDIGSSWFGDEKCPRIKAMYECLELDEGLNFLDCKTAKTVSLAISSFDKCGISGASTVFVSSLTVMVALFLTKLF